MIKLNQAQRKAASEAVDEFLDELYGKDKERVKYVNLDLLLTLLAGAGISVMSTALTFDFPPEVELPEPPPPAAPVKLLTPQQLVSRLPTSSGPRRLRQDERVFVQDVYAAALHQRTSPGFVFKAEKMLAVIKLLREVSAETENV